MRNTLTESGFPPEVLNREAVACILSVSRQENGLARGGGMKRREFLESGSIASASLAFARPKCFLSLARASDGWRAFQVTTRVEVLKPSGATHIWVPAALLNETPFQ